MRMRKVWAFAAFALTVWCTAALAQQTVQPTPKGGTLVVVNTEALYQRTALGKSGESG